MFRAQSAHNQEVNDANFTYAASGIVTLSKWPSCATAKAGLQFVWMNKKFVYQVGNNKKVILWCTANQISRQTMYI